MTEDVKLMAEFMGWTKIEDGKFHAYVGVNPINNQYSALPNYPKDMNALLGVMDRLKEYKGWPVPMKILGEAGASCSSFTDLPTVLFPLLVEAIKQTKESE